MAAAPVFASTPRNGFASVSTANTNRDGTGTIVDIITAPAAGTLVNRMVFMATGDPADSTCTIFIHDGTAYRLFDEVDLGNPSAASTTLPGFRVEKVYAGIVLSSGWKLAAAITVALTSGVINTFAFGADLT
jgi:hypothetical protein